MKIKVGLIGVGRMGRFYLKEMQKSGRWDISYICDVNPDSRELPAIGELKILEQNWNRRKNMKNGYGLLQNNNPKTIINP